MIRSFDIDSKDNLYVLDVSGGRVLVLDSTDALVREIAFAPGTGFAADIAVSSTGVVFAVDSLNKRVLVARFGEEILSPLSVDLSEDMALPTAMAADDMGNLFIADGSGHGIVIVGQNGEFRGRQSAMGWKEGFIRHPSDLFVANGDLFVADRSNNRVQRFEIVE